MAIFAVVPSVDVSEKDESYQAITFYEVWTLAITAASAKPAAPNHG